MSVTVTIGVAVISLLIALFIQWKRKYSKLPPGPQPMPIIGNYHQIGVASMGVDLTEIGKKYGDIFTVHFLMTPIIIMNSYKVIKDLLMSQEYAAIFSGRVANYVSKYLLPHSLIFQDVKDGQQYMRRIVMRGIEQYGTSLKRVERIAQEELGRLVERTREKMRVAFDPVTSINQYTSNIMMILICGERFDGTHHLMKVATELAADFEYILNYKNQVMMDMVPFSTHLPTALGTACQRIRKNTDIFSNAVEQMRKEDQIHQECLFSVLEEEYKLGNLNLDNVRGILLDMLMTGVLTMTPTISLCLLAMAHFPEIQKKIYEELVSVVGSEKLPGLEDEQNLPYSHATMLEVFRYFTPAPLPGPRTTIRECTYKGFSIPTDTMATYNVWNVHHDEEFWEKPYKFDPTRFLETDGNLIPPENERRMRLLTFGLGKRSCVSEILARVRTFLALTAIVQNFNIVEDPSHPLPSSDPRTYRIMFLTIPPPFKLRFLPRQNYA